MKTFAEAERLLSREPDRARAPQRDPGRWQALEQRLGILCPPSIRQWYERDDATRVLAAYSNDDRPLAPAHMRLVDDSVVFLVENQGVCHWAFRLDGRDDPEIVVQYEAGAWQSCGCAFAGFVAAQVFDWASGWAEDARTLAGDPPSEQTLEWLAERFQRGPVAHQHGLPTHRFADDSNRISILDDEWWVKSSTFAAMDRLLDMLQPFYDAEL